MTQLELLRKLHDRGRETFGLGEQAKTNGIKAVQKIGTDFSVKVDCAIRLLARGSEPFSSNDVRHIAQVEPHHPNAWGAAFNKAARAGVIQRYGFAKSTTPSRHASMVTTWVGVR